MCFAGAKGKQPYREGDNESSRERCAYLTDQIMKCQKKKTSSLRRGDPGVCLRVLFPWFVPRFIDIVV